MVRNDVHNFTSMIVTEGRARGMTIPKDPYVYDVEFGRNDRDHNARVQRLDGQFRQIKAGFQNPKSSLILVVIPPKPTDCYGQVKQAAERADKADVLTCCVQDKNFYKNDRSIIRNILLKMNAKLGGINHVPLYPEPAFAGVSILRVPTLIIGIDVTHPSLPIAGENYSFGLN